MEQMQQQNSDAEDQQQLSPLLSESLPESSVNSPVQQRIDDSGASDQGSQHSYELMEEDEESEGHYDQQYEESDDVASDQEPSDAQDYPETMPSESGRAAYPGSMKSKGNVPRVHLIVAEDDEEGTISGEEGKDIRVCVFVYGACLCICMLCMRTYA
jgi:hypothetical protein